LDAGEEASRRARVSGADEEEAARAAGLAAGAAVIAAGGSMEESSEAAAKASILEGGNIMDAEEVAAVVAEAKSFKGGSMHSASEVKETKDIVGDPFKALDAGWVRVEEDDTKRDGGDSGSAIKVYYVNTITGAKQGFPPVGPASQSASADLKIMAEAGMVPSSVSALQREWALGKAKGIFKHAAGAGAVIQEAIHAGEMLGYLTTTEYDEFARWLLSRASRAPAFSRHARGGDGWLDIEGLADAMQGWLGGKEIKQSIPAPIPKSPSGKLNVSPSRVNKDSNESVRFDPYEGDDPELDMLRSEFRDLVWQANLKEVKHALIDGITAGVEAYMLVKFERENGNDLDFPEFQKGIRKVGIDYSVVGDVQLARIFKAAADVGAGARGCAIKSLALSLSQGGYGVEKMPTTPSRGSPRKSEKAASPTVGRTGRMVLCHICQGRFLASSLSRHLPSCKAKYEKVMCDALPPSLAVDIMCVECEIPENSDPPESFDAYNAAAEIAHKASVPRCPECQEAFLPDKLLKHMRKCCLGRFESTAAAISVFISEYEGDANEDGDPVKRLEQKETKNELGTSGSLTPKGLKGKGSKSTTPIASPKKGSPTGKKSPSGARIKTRRTSFSKMPNVAGDRRGSAS